MSQSLADKNKPISGKMLIALVLILIGVIGVILVVGPKNKKEETGWTTIGALEATGKSCSADVHLIYDIGHTDMKPSKELKTIQTIYSNGAISACVLFDAEEETVGIRNLWYINHHIGEEVAVDSALYTVFEALRKNGSRDLYGGVLQEYYEELMKTLDTQVFDRAFAETLGSFASSDESVCLHLLGNNKVKLTVSDEYRRQAKAKNYENYLDFGWMRNACRMDYLANLFIQNGYTHGYFQSSEGFYRYLDPAVQETHAFQIQGKQNGNVTRLGEASFEGPGSVIRYQNYEIGLTEQSKFHEVPGGGQIGPYINLTDGLCKTALPDFVVVGKEKGCLDTLLRSKDLYMAERFDEEKALKQCTAEGLQAYYAGTEGLCRIN